MLAQAAREQLEVGAEQRRRVGEAVLGTQRRGDARLRLGLGLGLGLDLGVGVGSASPNPNPKPKPEP